MEPVKALPEFTKYTLLSILGMLAMSCYILADTFFVSQSLGTSGLAALNLAIPAYNFIHGTGLMLGMGGATRFSVCKSQGKDKEANMVFTNTCYLSVVFSVLFFLVGLLLSENLASLLGADAAVFEMTNTYLKVLLLFSPAFIFNDVLLCFVRNDGNPQLSMAATVCGSFSNIILDYVFMFPLKMGIFGAVLATGLAPVIGILIMTPHWLKRNKGFHLVRTAPKLKPIQITFSLGFPSLLAQISSGIVMIVFNAIILGLIGNTGVAAYGVIANISLVIVSIYTGIAQGVQPLLSREYGRANAKSLRTFLNYGMLVTVVLSVFLYLITLLFADPIAMVFNSERNPELQRIAVAGLKLYFTSNLFVGYNILISTYFTSVEKALPAHVVSLLRGLVLIIPMAFLLSSLSGMTGVWLTYPATELIVSAVAVCFYLRLQKKAAG